jgi:hypothetical protein
MGLKARRTISREALKQFRGDPQLFCRSLRGAFPGTVAEALRALSTRTQDFNASTDELNATLEPVWPEPHPADFDWRFEKSTAEKLSYLVSARGRVLCLGTPTVYEAISRQGGKSLLIDQNPFLRRCLTPNNRSSFQIADLSRPLHIREQFDAVILDPPWYSKIYTNWLSQALALLKRSNGSLFVTLFRELTRPGAATERAQILSSLAAVGRVRILELDAVYETPRFEAEVLARLKLPQLPAWRVADLVQVEVRDAAAWQASKPSAQNSYGRTAERFLIGNQVVVVAHYTQTSEPIDYTAPDPKRPRDFILASVSNRDPIRGKLTVWTSRNRGANASGTHRIAKLLREGARDSTDAQSEAEAVTDQDRDAFERLLNDLALEL